MPSRTISRPRLMFATHATTMAAMTIARDLEQGDRHRRGDQAGRAAAEVAVEDDGAGQRRDDDHHDPGGGRAEVAALDVVDDRVVQVDHAADADVAGRADQVEQHAGQAELAGQGHHERRQPQLGDDDALQRAVGRGRGERGEHRGPPRVAEREHPQRDDGGAGGGEAGGQVDLAEQQHEDLGHAERDDERRLGHQVDQVARAKGTASSSPGR